MLHLDFGPEDAPRHFQNKKAAISPDRGPKTGVRFWWQLCLLGSARHWTPKS
jgi:hypothetical protein